MITVDSFDFFFFYLNSPYVITDAGGLSIKTI